MSMSEKPESVTMDRRSVASWCFYDWANSPFPAIVLTFVIPAYFIQAVAEDATFATSQWAFMIGATALAIAVASPVLGSIADQGRSRKTWLLVFTIIMAVGSALLWFAKPESSSTLLLLWSVAVSVFAFEIGLVFYNSMLPTLVPAGWLGRVSGWAWGLGYFGGLGGLMLVLLGFVQVEVPPFGLDKSMAEHVRVAGPIAALWLAVFCLPLFLWTPDRYGKGLPAATAVRSGLTALARTLRQLPRHRHLGRFLIARMIYTDGINTLFAFGGVYAAGTFGMEISEVIMFGALLNITAGSGALAFGWLDDWLGAKPTILIGLTSIVVLGVPLLLIESVVWFWVLGAAIGMFFGPVQSASRSLMARLTPIGKESEMFGLYALSGKVTAFVGPWLVGGVALAYDSQRAGLATVLPFLIVGGLLLYTLPMPKSREKILPE